jgi:SAM-dependent methyltransferase
VDRLEGLTVAHPSPYDAPELYDLVLEQFHLDLPFWLEEARAARGPVLEVACGTGRVLLHLLENGVDADGIDLAPAMLERLHAKAKAKGLSPRTVAADMHDFTMPRRYRRVFITFNGFAHCDTIEDQLRCLRCCREHLEPGGALVISMSYPSLAYWLEPEGERVLEMEVAGPSGAPVRMWDTRRRDRVHQRQHSLTEIEELDAAGQVVRAHSFETDQRWVYRFELELLLRAAGFARIEILGGWDRAPLERDDQQTMALGWKD